jgi:hypothetical protein
MIDVLSLAVASAAFLCVQFAGCDAFAAIVVNIDH